MATLTEVSAIARKGVVVGITFVIFLMFYPLIRATAVAIWQRYHPPPEPPPNSNYRQLPLLSFPAVQQQIPEIKLETISGAFPKLPAIGKVYLVETNKSRLSTLDKYRQKANVLTLSPDPIQIDDIRYRFNHPKIQAYMIVNLTTDQVEYKYDWTKDKDVIEPGNLETPDREIAKAKSFFESMNMLYDDMMKGPAKVSYYIATGSAFLPTNNYVEATFVRVDLFRDVMDGLVFVTAGGDTSPVNISTSSTKNPEMSKVAISYYYSRRVSKDEFATYPLMGVEKAFENLQQGKGFIVKNSLPSVKVRNINLGYFESNVPQDYIQPVYVFSGDGGFLAYVQAVDESKLVTAPATPTPTAKAK